MKYLNIKNKISHLKKSPLFYLFLSSKELFHTNFWAWLFEINMAEAIKLFSTSTHTNIKTPIREHKINYNPNSKSILNDKQTDNIKKISSVIDLFIKTEELDIVIENKVKDFPTIEQLERIVGSFGPSPRASFLLISLFDTEVIELHETWNVMNYQELSNKINPSILVKGISEDDKISYYESLIFDYKQFILNLHELAYDKELRVTNNYDFANEFNKDNGKEKGLFSLLDEIKFWEVYQKMRASHLKIEFEKFNKLSFIGPIVYGIHHQRSTINFPVIFLERKDKKGNLLEIGIQLENNEFRRYIHCNQAQKLMDKMKENGIFFDKNFISLSGKNNLNYGDRWKYQYEKIEKDSEITDFSKLFNKITNELNDLHNKKNEIIELFNEANK